MQTLMLENYGTLELSFDEQKEIDGGIWPIVLAAAALLSSCSREITKNLHHNSHGPNPGGLCTNGNHYHGAGGSY
jgi:hypothetical protein